MRSRVAVSALCVIGLLVGGCGKEDAASPTSEASPVVQRAVIIDGDFGPDDMMALLYLLERPEVDLAAVTITGTGLAHCPDGAENAAAVVSYMDRGGIPVACGERTPSSGDNAFPDDWRLGTDDLASQLGLAGSNQEVGDEAPQLIVDTLEGTAGEVDIVALAR